MEEREMKEFSWSIFFCVSAVCFLVFSLILTFLESSHSGLFLKAGLVLLGLGILTLLNKWLGQKLAHHDRTVSSPHHHELH